MSSSNFAERFEDLRIWQDARAQTFSIYRYFVAGSPGGKDFGFRDQICRAGVSVMNNIAEGFERKSPADFARFLDIAKGSCGEVRSMFYLAEDLSYIDSSKANQTRFKAASLSGSIEAMAKTLRSRK